MQCNFHCYEFSCSCTSYELVSIPPIGVPVAAPVLAQIFPANSGNFPATGSGQWTVMQHQQPSLFRANGIQSASQQYIPSVGGASSNQPRNLADAPNALVQHSNPVTQAPRDVSRSNRNDFFAMNYSSFPTPVPGWQTGPPHGMGFAMQYNTAVPMPTFQQSLKSATHLMSTVNLLLFRPQNFLQWHPHKERYQCAASIWLSAYV